MPALIGLQSQMAAHNLEQLGHPYIAIALLLVQTAILGGGGLYIIIRDWGWWRKK